MRIHKDHFLHIVLFVLIFFNAPAFANDAVEAAATGNIVFDKAPELVILEETLSITRSPGQGFGKENFKIDVDFKIKNKSDHILTRIIAFVLPPVECRNDFNTMWGGLDNSDNHSIGNNPGLKDFITTVDGKPIILTTRTEAKLGEKNITKLLNNANIPLNPCKIRVTAEGKPDPRYGETLKKYHLLTESNEAAWSQHAYFEWLQIFPPGKVITIHHSYTPVIGAAVPSPRPVEHLNALFIENTPRFNPIWSQNPATSACLIPEWVRYRLTTGAYWNGGIGLFKLIIANETGSPFAVNEFYSKENHPEIAIGKDKMTFTLKNFVPKQDLLILFVSLPKDNASTCPRID